METATTTPVPSTHVLRRPVLLCNNIMLLLLFLYDARCPLLLLTHSAHVIMIVLTMCILCLCLTWCIISRSRGGSVLRLHSSEECDVSVCFTRHGPPHDNDDNTHVNNEGQPVDRGKERVPSHQRTSHGKAYPLPQHVAGNPSNAVRTLLDTAPPGGDGGGGDCIFFS